jgi:hypothetical protein
VLLGPVVAIVCGALAGAIATARAPGRDEIHGAPARGASRRRPARGSGAPRFAAAIGVALGVSIVATMVTGVMLATSRHSHLRAPFVQAMAWIRGNAPSTATILSAADLGYDLQRYTGRGTVMDGLLESRENQRRILEVYGAFLSRETAALDSVCARYGVTHFLVPSGDWLYVFAEVAGEPFAHKLRRGIALDQDEMDRAVIRLMLAERVPEGFREVFEHEGFRIYAVEPSEVAPRHHAP